MESLCIYGLVISVAIADVQMVSRCLSAGMSRCWSSDPSKTDRWYMSRC
jgi:hypothetical protein